MKSSTASLFSRMAGQVSVIFAVLMILSGWSVLAEEPGVIQVGTGAVVITPPQGTPMAGYYSARGSEGVIDDLYAKAMVLDDGQTRVALVSCDLIGIPANVVGAAREKITAATSLPGEHVLISSSHTHTGPVLRRDSRRDEMDGGTSDLAQQYTNGLPEKIAQAVAEAMKNLRPCRLAYARQQEHELSFCRRFWMKDGTVGWNPGKLNPNIIRPINPIDPDVLVLYVETTEKAPVAAYVNFALHCDTVGGTLISADYPGVLAKRLADYKGPQFVTLFGNGTCGDINHINVQWADRQKGPEEAGRIGTILAGDVMKALMKLQPISDTRVAVRREIVTLPLAPITEDDVKRAKEIVAQGSKAPFLDQVFAYKVLDVAERNGQPLEAEVQVIVLGQEVAWVALPGEIFADLGLSIKAVSPFRQTFVVELANGSLGYIPNRSAYAEGQYEVVSARCAEGSGEMLVNAALRLLTELHGAE